MENQKQIKEIAKIICRCEDGICRYDGKPCDLACTISEDARVLYEAGYRRSGEFAREIIEIIEAVREEFSPTEYHRGYNDALDDFKRAIEKKFVEEEE